jgi:chromosome segregation ATPase
MKEKKKKPDPPALFSSPDRPVKVPTKTKQTQPTKAATNRTQPSPDPQAASPPRQQSQQQHQPAVSNVEAELRSEIERLKKENAALAKTNTSLASQRLALETANSMLNAEIVKLKKAKDNPRVEAASEVTALTVKLEVSEKDRRRYRSQRDILKGDLDRAETELEKVRKERDGYIAEHSQLEDKFAEKLRSVQKSLRNALRSSVDTAFSEGT